MDAELQAYREKEKQQKEKEERKVERIIEKEAS
jgi:hypothetical protein